MTRASLTPVDEVIKYLVSQARCLVTTEEVGLADAAGRVLAADVVSTTDVPLMDNSAMDGYAVNTSGLSQGDILRVSDRIAAGSVGQKLVPGTAARIFTGAPIPEGANAIVIQEDTEVSEGGVRLNAMPIAGENVRQAGQDIRKGATILSRGRRLKAQDIGLIASVGCGSVEVFKKLKIAVMSTGDELIEPGTDLKPGQIYNSNHYTLQAMIRQLGMEPVDLGMVRDSSAATIEALERGAALADCILSSGGVSVGEEDHVKGAVEQLGELAIWRVAIKPGKPLAFGYVKGTPFLACQATRFQVS